MTKKVEPEASSSSSLGEFIFFICQCNSAIVVYLAGEDLLRLQSPLYKEYTHIPLLILRNKKYNIDANFLKSRG